MLQPVVAAVIERDRRVLICQRPQGKRHGGLWEFPGGKVHADESIPEAVSRELAEELAVQTTEVGEVLFSRVDQRSGFEILFLHATVEGEPVALEHSEIVWCEPAQLLSYPLAPSDHAFASFYLRTA
ncbi:(deoxy)nucleoside triphosphate pyrophosphohydrolase [Longimicrobium sp.]|uniref:(deoxy)nucleoside triphosphate pyrophosphohydrolase n=1 Tax=Longimicrobium sp. TaxID=2029185 RepID=UPI003B3BDD56